MRNIKPWAVGLACLLLAACNAPRGAGFQSEVLAASGETGPNGEAVYDFAVFEVTRAALPVIGNWPRTGQGGYGWINGGAQPASVLISPGDRLQVSVWDAEENSLLTTAGQRMAELQAIEVGADGRIFIPFVGELRVAGMSPGRARARIEEELTATVPSAQVQLSLEPGRGNTANLVSGVGRPGVYPLTDSNTSVLELIAEGGGVRSELVNPQVRLLRGNDIYGTSVDRLFKSPKLDTVLRGGDRVLIEEEERAFLSLGAANRQARHIFPTDQVTALDALAIIGGVAANSANPEGILVLRTYPSRAVRDGVSGPPMDRVVFTLDLTSADGLFSAGRFPIYDGDLVYATESPLNAARTIFGLLDAGADLFNKLN